jgi:lysozyme family protein
MFDDCFDHAMKLEGGYVDNKRDPGGATNFGISIKYLKSLVKKRTEHKELNDVLDKIIKPITNQSIKNLTKQDAKIIYFYDWWVRCKIQQFDHFFLCRKVFSACINMGDDRAIKLLQKSANSLLKDEKIDEDGDIGPQTIDAISGLNKDNLLDLYVLNLCDFYKNLVREKCALSIFLDGWLKRAKD